MKNNVKMIALDLDGTTLNDKREISTYTKQVIEQAIEQGIVVLACTGRPLNAIPDEFLAIKGVKYVIASNGARVYDMDEKETIFEGLLSVDGTKEIIVLSSEYNSYKEIFWSGQGYTTYALFDAVSKHLPESMSAYIRETRIMVDSLEELMVEKDSPCDKVHIAFAKVGEREEAQQRIRDLGGYECDGALETSLEITAPGVTKASGLLKLADKLGITTDEIMAIGDGMNDASMMRVVGVSVAMGNAIVEIKELAKHTTDSNNNDGAAKAIVTFALE